MLVSPIGSGPHGEVDFHILWGSLQRMAAGLLHEITEFIKGTQLLLHSSAFGAEQLYDVGFSKPLEI